ncbi:MAG: DUF167 domain-containing protein [Alphaproteobacteria bacterium]|nr:DUF167 domain-containing protein [Alphaproteobacteria bacterium]
MTLLRRGPSGVTIELTVQPRARRNALVLSDAGLKVQVTAPAEDGKANRAVIDLLAEAWRFPKSTFAVIKGATARRKTLAVAGDPALLSRRIEEWMKDHG